MTDEHKALVTRDNAIPVREGFGAEATRELVDIAMGKSEPCGHLWENDEFQPAVFKAQLDYIGELLERKPDLNICMGDIPDTEGEFSETEATMSFFHYEACFSEAPQLIELYLQSGLDFDTERTDKIGATPLYGAVEAKDAGTVAVLLKSGRCDPDRPCVNDPRLGVITPRQRARINGYTEILAIIRAFRPDPQGPGPASDLTHPSLIIDRS